MSAREIGQAVTGDALTFISAPHLKELLPGAAVVGALEAGLRSRSRSEIDPLPRLVLERAGSEFLLMPAIGPEGAGAKLVSVVPENPGRELALINGLYVLFSRETMIPEALIDGAALTRLRTAAVSALAARHLARVDSRRLVVFGAGAQAEAHIEILKDVFPIEQVTVIGSSPHSPRAAALTERLLRDGTDAAVGSASDVRFADLVCTCTTSREPLFDSALLAPGAHVCAVGAYKPEMCELDLRLFETALVVVETRSAALKEAGDLIQALDAGVLREADFAHEVIDLLGGEVHRRTPGQVSVFKSVGLPLEDLIVARAAVDRLACVG